MLKTLLLQKKMYVYLLSIYPHLHTFNVFLFILYSRESMKRERCRDASPLIHSLGDAKALMLIATPRPLYPRQGGMVPIFVKDGCVLRPLWADAENLAHTGVGTSESQARKESHLTYTNTYFGLLSNDSLMLARIPKCQLSSFTGRYAT
jgi:hypothetical protein